jgi:apolipoprotein N-acyltransferase
VGAPAADDPAPAPAGATDPVPGSADAGAVRGVSGPWAGALALGSGFALLGAFPPYGQWWLAPIGVAMLALAVAGRRARHGALLGLLHGGAFFVPLLHWTGLYVGAFPWLLLAASQTVFLVLLGAVGPWAWRRPALLPPLTAALWVGQEALRSRLPFGGFPWGRLAFSQEDAPTLRLASLGGAPLVTFAVALAGGLLALAVLRAAARPRRRAGPALAAAGAVAVMLLGAAVPLRSPGGPEVTVAVVQGNVPRLGLDFNAQRRAVLDNHVRATLDLARRVEGGRTPRPDLVVWPENSSDIDPLRNPDARPARSASRSWSAPCWRGPATSSATPASSGTPRPAPGRRTSSSTRCRSPSTCRSARSPGRSAPRWTSSGTTSPPGTAPGCSASDPRPSVT